MKKIIVITLTTVTLSSFQFFEQETVDVAESTLKIAGLGEEVFYYGFAEGDQIIFNFEEVNGKELKEVEIIELPSSSKFMDYKTKKIVNKTFNITTTGIYKFRFSNSAIGGRICKFKIQRVPASEITKNFNTNVYWKTVYDTTYTTVQEKYLVKSDTTVSNITDQVAKVHSQGNLNGNITTFNFTLPDNTVKWSYYIGVDQEGQKAYEDATKQLAKSAAPLLAKISPLTSLMLSGISYIARLQSGEDIDFYIVDNNNVNLFTSGLTFNYYKKGKVINDYSIMTAPIKGMYHVCLYNDNAITGVNVTVKITAIVVTEQWGTRPKQIMHVHSHQEAYLKN
ncbi:MAG: hypothetical protein ACOZCO_00775 [Bacteroidota bacterium]